MSWNTIRSDEAFSSPYLIIHRDAVELPDSLIIDDFYTVTIPDAAAVVALTKDKQFILKREYRYACREETLEIPAGAFEQDESDPLIVAKRELLEETGYESNEWSYLGATRECTSKLTHKMHIFFAKNCVKTSSQKLDVTEHIDVLLTPINQAIKMVLDNEITCNCSARGILQVSKILGDQHEL